MSHDAIDRRELLKILGVTAAGVLAAPAAAMAQGALAPAPHARRIPSSGALLPVVGLGSWITFNVGDDAEGRSRSAQVIRAFFEAGGTLIDSSPMYGSSQAVIGDALRRLGRRDHVFSADKVWTRSASAGESQLEETRRFWGVPSLDLVQVHNLLSWESHLPMLFAMKRARRIRYVGITTSEGRRNGEIEQLMRTQPLDFAQFTYNILDREAEARLLPRAAERGVATLINRPFREGSLIRQLRSERLPEWAREIECSTWPQFLLKFIISHPAVTCVIPATSSVAHLRENMRAARGPLPDERMRRRMIAYVEQL